MTKCLVCKTGKVTLSGCHEYCDSCAYHRFVVTADYVDACGSFLGTLMSNTRFQEEVHYRHAMLDQIQNHLPMLWNWFTTLEAGYAALTDQLAETVKAQAINLQIANATHNPEEDNSLECWCGCKEFHNDGLLAEIFCKDCTAKYLYNEETGLFEPWFLCSCGCTDYNDLDGTVGECGACQSAYMLCKDEHGKEYFRRL